MKASDQPFARIDARMTDDLIQRLHAYHRQLAPHAKQREGGQLIAEAAEALQTSTRGAEFIEECCRQRGSLLEEIADLAHVGGSSGLDPYDVLVIVRQLTGKYWRTGGTNE